MTTAVIARADQGGLASQTWEIARHVRPAKILVVDLGANGRGRARVERYEALGADLTVCNGYPKKKHLDWLLDGIRALYTAEGTYGDDLPMLAAHARVRLVIHANPELWCERYRDASTEIVLPTTWEADRVPGASVMPMPVDRERLPWRQREHAKVLWHPAAPAMEDRNGTQIVRAALKYVTHPCRIIVTGTGVSPHETKVGRATVEVRGDRENYWELYDEADVLLLPRRYGGLSLPCQEALSAGLPVVMLDTGPYAGEPGVLTVPTSSARDVRMKGGIFPVYDADPEHLADEIVDLATHPQLVQRASRAANDTAEALSWQRWENPWRQLLERP